MKKIDKLFVKAFIGPFVLTTAIVVFIFLLRFLMMYFEDFIGKDLGLDVFGKLFLYFSLITVPTALPLATLLATLMCFGNMGEHSELTAMKSAGIPLSRLILPTLYFSIVVSIFSFFYNNYVNPWANLKGYSLLWDVKNAKLTLNIQPGIFYKELPGYRLKVQEKMPDGNSMKNVIIYDHTSNNGNRNVTIADSGRMYFMNNGYYLVFELFNGKNYVENQNNFNKYDESQFVRNSFKKNKIVFSMETFGIKRTNEDQFKYHEYMKNTSELSAQIDTVRRDIRSKTKDQTRQLKSQNAYLFRTNYGKVDSTKKAVPIMVGNWIQDKMKVSETSYREMEILETSISQLKNFISTLETDRTIILNRNKEVWRADIERWHKITMAFSCMVMFLIGSSLGSIIKKGGFGMPVLVSISFFILLYVLMQLGDKYAKEGIIPVLVGVWIPNTVLLLIGIYLMSKASNDSRLFENDTLVKFQNTLSNLMSVFKKKKVKTDTV